MSLTSDQQERIRSRMRLIYDEPEKAENTAERIIALAERYQEKIWREPEREERFDSGDVFLITYGDMVQSEGHAPLSVLHAFAKNHLREALNTIHILPCFPWTSDDGFSVVDYRVVDPELGEWSDLETMSADFRLMYDYVCNHCSAESPWFTQYLNGEKPGIDYFIEVDPGTDLSAVTRPRPTPVLTKVETSRGERHVWTTFSSDQVDLNFQSPECLLDMLDVMLLYFERGASVLRLDAIAFLWKQIGTSCLHLPQTHEVVKLMRDLVDILYPQAILLTETNVPHKENISYFGQGDEAHMVYQFSLPPLVMHGILTGTAEHLTRWAAALNPPPEGCSFLNFTASHDGVGVRPLEGIVNKEEVDKLCAATRERGGQVSMRTQTDGSQSPYELNITYFEAVSDPEASVDDNIQRFLCSQAIPLALQGIPAVYFHSLTATRNWHEGVKETGRARTINRRKWQIDELEDLLEEESTTTSRVFDAYRALLSIRRQQLAFHPQADQKILQLDDRIFAVQRTADDGTQHLLCLFNLSGDEITLKVPPCPGAGNWTENLVANEVPDHHSGKIILRPHNFAWLNCVEEH